MRILIFTDQAVEMTQFSIEIATSLGRGRIKKVLGKGGDDDGGWEIDLQNIQRPGSRDEMRIGN